MVTRIFPVLAAAALGLSALSLPSVGHAAKPQPKVTTTSTASKVAAAAKPKLARTWQRSSNYTYNTGAGVTFNKVVAYHIKGSGRCTFTLDYRYTSKTSEFKRFQVWVEFPDGNFVRTNVFQDNVAGARSYIETYKPASCWAAQPVTPMRIHVTSCFKKDCTPPQAGLRKDGTEVSPPVAKPPAVDLTEVLSQWVETQCVKDIRGLFKYQPRDSNILSWLAACRTGSFEPKRCKASRLDPNTECSANAIKLYPYRASANVLQAFSNACKTTRCTTVLGLRSAYSGVDMKCVQTLAKASRMATRPADILVWLKQCRSVVNDPKCSAVQGRHNSQCVNYAKKLSRFGLSEQNILDFVQACKTYHYRCTK